MSGEPQIPGSSKSRSAEAFFGRRKGQQLRPGQQNLYETLLPILRLDLENLCPTDLSELFPDPVDHVRMEIGFGGGEHLAHQARANPHIGYIGIEPYINGMAKLLAVIDRQKLSNIRLYDDDATRVLDWLPEASVERVDLMYPDPWPKKRHWKRRFVSQKNLNRITRALNPGGSFRFASDIDSYVNWTLHHANRNPHLTWTANCAGDWFQPFDDWLETRYEAKAIREGRTPAYLTFDRHL